MACYVFGRCVVQHNPQYASWEHSLDSRKSSRLKKVRFPIGIGAVQTHKIILFDEKRIYQRDGHAREVIRRYSANVHVGLKQTTLRR
jgi:hypothetical protein